MSASTISTTVQVNRQTAARMAARRAALRAERDRVREQRAAARERELAAAGVRDARRLASLGARRDVAMVGASSRDVAAVDVALERAQREGSLDKAEALLKRLEHAAEQRLRTRAQGETVLAEVIERVERAGNMRIVPNSVAVDADGVARARVALRSGGEMPVVAPVASGEAQQELVWGTGQSGVDRYPTPRGVEVGCDAQEAMLADALASVRAAGIEIAMAPLRQATTAEDTAPGRTASSS